MSDRISRSGAIAQVGVPIENNRGQRIVTLADWQRLAPPASPRHWREYRSAFELAHAWTEGDGAHRLRELLATREQFVGLRLERAIAERKSWFDDIPGAPRNHDLLVTARTTAGPVVIGIEAKADEAFDRDLAGYGVAARRHQANTRAPERLDRLTRALFNTTVADEPSLARVRYQLLSALAGTLAEAKYFGALAAVLVVHEFVTPETDPIKQRRNARDLDAFLARLGTAPKIVLPHHSWLAGLYRVPGNLHLPGAVPVYVGKLVTRIEQRTESPPSSPGGATAPQTPPVTTGDPLPNTDHNRPPEGRHQTTIAIPSGTAVIKLNVHPLGCHCGCERNEVFVVNRPGRNPRQNIKLTDLDAAIAQMREWALDTLRARELPTVNPSSTFDIAGGMTTVTLTVRPPDSTPRFTAKQWGNLDEQGADDLDTALRPIRQWAEEGARPSYS